MLARVANAKRVMYLFMPFYVDILNICI